MNTLQKENATNFSVVELHEMLAHAINEETDQYNDLMLALENSEQEKSFLKLQVNTLESRNKSLIDELNAAKKLLEQQDDEMQSLKQQCQQVVNNADKHLLMIEQKTREFSQLKTRHEADKATLNKFKAIDKTPELINKKIKAYKESVATHLKNFGIKKQELKDEVKKRRSIEASLKDVKRELLEVQYSPFYNKNGEIMAVYPRLCEAGLDDNLSKKVPIWYMDKGGVGALYMLNEDGEPQRSPTPKGGLRPSKEARELMRVLLTKFEANGNVVYGDDLKMFEVE